MKCNLFVPHYNACIQFFIHWFVGPQKHNFWWILSASQLPAVIGQSLQMLLPIDIIFDRSHQLLRLPMTLVVIAYISHLFTRTQYSHEQMCASKKRFDICVLYHSIKNTIKKFVFTHILFGEKAQGFQSEICFLYPTFPIIDIKTSNSNSMMRKKADQAHTNSAALWINTYTNKHK